MRYVYMIILALISASAMAIPQAGQEGVDTTYGAYDWVVCRADSDSAWISADSSGTYSPINVCEELGYTGVNAVGGTCGTVCGYCGQDIEHYDGAGGSAEHLEYTVTWRCVSYEGAQDVPEFSLVGGAIALTGIGLVICRRRH